MNPLRSNTTCLTPLSRSRCAMVLPIAFAPSMLPPFALFASAPFTAGSTVEADAIVRPVASSTTCTYMCATLRNTVSRGRSCLPATRLRIRCLIRSRRSSFVLIRILFPVSSVCRRKLLGSCLPDLLLQHFTRVADALLLVGIGLPHAADVGRDLANQLTIDARDRDMRLLLDGDVDSRRDVVDHRVRVAKREVHLLALQLGAVADADDIELVLEAVGDSGRSVADE